MKRVFSLLFGGILIAGVLLDPYTFRESASDEMIRAPWWQTTTAMLQIALLVSVVIFAWRGLTYRAFLTLVVEASVNLVTVIAQILRDGVSRFIMGVAAEQYLTWYLASIALRVFVLAWLAREAMIQATIAVQSERGSQPSPRAIL